MTFEQISLFTIFALLLVMFAWGRVRYDIVAFSGLLVAVVVGVVPADDAFSGFGHPATVIVALVLIASAGLIRSGAVQMMTKRLINSRRSTAAHIGVMGSLGALMSGFMNNIAALALLMPVDTQTARKAKRAVGYTLMPLAFATILGGMITLIGTPPNILVSTFRQEALGTPFRMFDFAPVGGLIAVAGVAFIALIGWRLIPVRGGASTPSALIDDYVAELVVPEGSDLIGKFIRDLEDEAESADVAILSLHRDGKPRHGSSRYVPLAANDVLVVEASPEALDEFRSSVKLDYPKNTSEVETQITGKGMALIEAVVMNDSRINGKTAQALGLGWRHHTILMGISREGKTIRDRVRRTVILPGDILLLLVPEETQHDVVIWLNCLPLASGGMAVTNESRALWGLGVFAAAIALVTSGLVTMPIALGFVVVGYLMMRVLSLHDLYNHVDWPVIVLLGSMIPLGLALDATGGTAIIASGVLVLTSGWPAWVSVLVLMVVVMFLSDVLNNNATTILAAPVGIRLAEQLGVNPDAFLMAVAVAASCAFLTPIGHQNNTVILGPGGYRFGDYWRMGLPLEAIVLAVGLPAILFFWPL